MSKTLDNLFLIRSVINNSEEPLSISDIEDISGIKKRSVQRYAMRLANENLVDFKGFSSHLAGSNCYKYAKIGYWESN